MEYSDGLTSADMSELMKQVEEWEKEILKAKVKLEESKLKALFKGIGKMFRFR